VPVSMLLELVLPVCMYTRSSCSKTPSDLQQWFHWFPFGRKKYPHESIDRPTLGSRCLRIHNPQILDLPGIIQGAKDGKGRGRQVISVAKTCHLIFIVLDVNKPLTDKRVIENELEGFGIRCNKSPPNIHFKKKDKGGLAITNTVPLTHIDHDEIKAVMQEYKISSADIAIRCDATIDDLIDVLEAKSRSYIPVIYALNKIDAISIEELDLLYRIPNACPISSEHGWNVDELMEQMWDKLNLCRVYTKPKGRAPDYTAPVVLRANACTVEDFVSYSSLPYTVSS
jgi:small GTP-binding protein